MFSDLQMADMEIEESNKIRWLAVNCRSVELINRIQSSAHGGISLEIIVIFLNKVDIRFYL